MSKIKTLFKTLENIRTEFYKDGDKILQVNRQADQNGHQCIVHLPNGEKEEMVYLDQAEYERVSKLPRADSGDVGPQK